MHSTKRWAERRAAQPGNSKRNKDLEKTTVRNYFPNGVREACSLDLLCRTIRNDFPKLYMYVCFLFHSPKTLRAIPCLLRRVTGRSNFATPFPQKRGCATRRQKTLLRVSISFCFAYQKTSFRSRWFSKQGPRGAQRRSLRRGIRNDFPFGLIFTNRGLRGAQRSSGIQDEARAQSNLPLGITFFYGGREACSADPLRRAIRNDSPFGMDFAKLGLTGTRRQNALLCFVFHSASLCRKQISNPRHTYIVVS